MTGVVTIIRRGDLYGWHFDGEGISDSPPRFRTEADALANAKLLHPKAKLPKAKSKKK